MKRLLLLFIPVLAMVSACTPNQVNAWKRWYQADPVAAEAFLESDTFDEINNGATATRQAERLNPPPPQEDAPAGFSSDSSNGRCIGAEDLLRHYSPGWSVERMSRIMYRESRCNPGAYNRSGATGLLQVLRSHCRWLASRIGGCDLTNPSYNIRAAAELWKNGGYQHWATR